jgi:hypothetical protein
VVIFAWICLAIWAAYGITKMTSVLSLEFFFPRGTLTESYFNMDIEYFQTGNNIQTIVDNPDIDFASEDV